MDFELAGKLNLPTLTLPKPSKASVLDDRLLCNIIHHTLPIKLTFPASHTEELCSHLCQASCPLILGHPRLISHNLLDLSNVPSCCMDLTEVFNKIRATSSAI